jgi:hypothetical protein
MLCGVVYLDITLTVPSHLPLMLTEALVTQVHLVKMVVNLYLDGMRCRYGLKSRAALAPTMI